MFRRKPPEPKNDQNTLETQLKASEQREQELLYIIGYLQNAANQMHATISEQAYIAQSSRSPIGPPLQAMHEMLSLEKLATLPLGLAQNNPEAEKDFEKITGHHPKKFSNPTLTAAELLGFRLHTATRLLVNMASGSKITPSDIQYQAKNDLNVIIEHERARSENRS